MSTLLASPTELTDPELLSRCQRGERDAFGYLVSRYQGLVCAQAYAVCGDLGKSEDVAQEAFISAWRQLPELREPSKFKAWLCGIARRLALRIVEKRERDTVRSETLSGEAVSADTPHDALVSREEEAIVWEALAQLPESYRMPLVLFYREQQSVFEVAHALDLSEDAVKQRLSRGRAMLKQQVATVVENALSRSRPGAAFAAAVLASIGAAGATTASAATTAVAAAKSGGSLGFASLSLPLLSGVAGTGLGVVGAWLGVKISAESAPYERERQELLTSGRTMGKGVAAFVVLQLGAVFLGMSVWKSVAGTVGMIAGLTALYLAWLLTGLVQIRARVRRIRHEEEAAGTPVRMRPLSGLWKYFAITKRTEYRSRRSFLGLPLLHVVWDNHAKPDPTRREARGWIAMGDRATGVVAFGGIARGLFAFGGLAIGPFAFGGIGIGIFSVSGCALGAWCYGGVALGWMVHAGLGVGWEVALAAFAVAKQFGLGALVVAPHINDAAAQAAASQSAWLQLTTRAWFPLAVPALIFATFVVQGWITLWSQRAANRP